MIPIINTQNKTEFELSFKYKFIYSPSSKISFISVFDGELEDSLEIKLFIQDIYQKYYRAKINVNYPNLMAILDKNHNILAAVGFRLADQQDLFLEQYLDGKIEDILSLNYQKNILRNQIVEIGSLASNGKGMSKFLFIALATYLRKIGYSYAAMTGTAKLRDSLNKLNLKVINLCEADKNKLTHKNEDWGSYYNSKPQVLAGNIDSGYKTLKTVLGASIISSTTKLYPYE
jgi:hypothetical protein